MANQHDAYDYAALAHRVLESVARQLMNSTGDGAAANDDANATSYGLGGDPTNAGSADGSGDDAEGFDSTVFWGVNGFLLFMLLTMIVWCCCCKKDWLLNPEARRAESDAAFRQRLRRRLEQQKASKIDTPEQRKQKLLESFMRHGVTMTVTEEDLLDETYVPEQGAAAAGNNGATSETENDIEAGNAAEGENDMESSRDMSTADSINATGFLKLPELSDRQPVPNCCAICLGEYEVDDHVVWSSNMSCAHAFHEECILEWLIKMQPETPCPCCRQEFTDLEAIRKEKKVIWSGDAFNFNGITL